MKFLLTNDDGIASPGLAAIVDVMKHYGDVFVVCPDKDQSGVGHSITFREPLKFQRTMVFGDDVKAWTVNGTPADCVKMALDVLVPNEINFVVSGMNLGSNVGRDSYYSGTISAAREASYYGLPAVAVSLDITEMLTDYGASKKLFNDVMRNILAKQYSPKMLLNVNIPNVEELLCKGVKFADLDFSIQRYKLSKEMNQDGEEVYWAQDNPAQLSFDNLDGDFYLLQEGYITVTPLEVQLTNQQMKREVEHWFAETLKI